MHQAILGERDEGGFALLMVLWTLMLLSAIATSILLETKTTSALAIGDFERLNAHLTLDGAINRAILALIDPSDDLELPLDGRPVTLDVLDRNITINVWSEAGKLDINAAPPSSLATFFEKIGLNEQRAQAEAAAIAEWRTATTLEDRVRINEVYGRLGKPYGPRFAPFRSVGELALVAGMSETILSMAEPMLTVWSGNPDVDRTVASGTLLHALAEGGDALARLQESAEKLNGASKASGSRKAALGEIVTVKASMTTPRGPLSRVATIQVAGEASRPFRVLEWH